MQAQFPIHSGRVLRIAGRVVVSSLGVIIGVLSATGIVIWARKRRQRSRRNVETDATQRREIGAMRFGRADGTIEALRESRG